VTGEKSQRLTAVKTRCKGSLALECPLKSGNRFSSTDNGWWKTSVSKEATASMSTIAAIFVNRRAFLGDFAAS
jgi:hypothetical protein